MQHSVWAAEIRMKLVADKFKKIDQAFDYSDPANHNSIMTLKTISSGGEKLIVARRYILGDNMDYYIDFITPMDTLEMKNNAVQTGEHGRVEIYLNKEYITRDNFGFENGPRRGGFAGKIAKNPALLDISDYYDRAKLETDLDHFTKSAYKKKIMESVVIELVAGDPFIETVQFVEGLVIKGGGTIFNALPKQAKSLSA